MKRSEMIKQLVKILDTMPEGASNYHIVDMLLGAAERRGILPPKIENMEVLAPGGYLGLEEALKRGLHEWEEEDEYELF